MSEQCLILQEVLVSVECVLFRELVEAKQAVRAQALKEMLSSLQVTPDEQFFTSHTLHSSLMAQLQTFHTQV